MRTSIAFVVALFLVAWTGTAQAQQSAQPGGSPGAPELEVDTDLPMGPILLGSFGLVLVGVGAGFGWQAHEEHEDWDEARKAGDPTGEMDELADDVKAHSIAANVLMFGGAGIAAVSLILLLVRGGDDEAEGGGEPTTASWRPTLGPGQAGLSVRF
jgi:hypothetical protein